MPWFLDRFAMFRLIAAPAGNVVSGTSVEAAGPELTRMPAIICRQTLSAHVCLLKGHGPAALY